jgi:hypothetical protein
MKLKRTSRRLVRRIALGLAVAAIAAPSAGAYLAAPVPPASYNDNAVKNAALAHAYDVWNQNRGKDNAVENAALANAYESWKQNGATDTTRLAYLLSTAFPGRQDVSGILRKYDMIPHHILDQSGPISRPAPADAYLDKGGMVIPADLSGRQFGPAALPTESTPVSAPESRFGPGRVLPVASPGEEFTWDDATIGIVAGLGTALIAAMIGVALLSRRDRLARA